MKQAAIGYLIDTVSRSNVLPVISECNTSCIFCSHRFNPANVEVFALPRLSYDDFREIITYLSGDRKIIIGESATRIIEGEPLLHPEFPKILAEVRRRFPNTALQITTNGTLLNKALVDCFAELGNIELNVSCNCIRPESRGKVLGRRHDEDYAERLALLIGKVRFSGSIVAVPDMVGPEEIRATIGLLEEYGADMAKIFVPGYTRLSDNSRGFLLLYEETRTLASDINNGCSIPVIVEPALLKNLTPQIEGIIL
jgi:MoaA/NifB/PqqE/SkfB family radical SAM enzyme